MQQQIKTKCAEIGSESVKVSGSTVRGISEQKLKSKCISKYYIVSVTCIPESKKSKLFIFFINQNATSTPNYNKIKRTLYRISSEKLPKSSATFADLLNVLNRESVMENFGRTKHDIPKEFFKGAAEVGASDSIMVAMKLLDG